MSLDFTSLYSLYRSELLDRTIPFWLKYGVDWKNGGISTCISDSGEVLSEDKYMWSQLRALWTFSTLYNKVERQKEWLDVAEHIYDFVKKYGRDAEGTWVYVLSKEGKPLQGSISIYTDGFAIYGLTEFARASGNLEAISIARETFVRVQNKLNCPGSYSTAPHPIPAGFKAHGVAMSFALFFFELGSYLNDPEIIQAGLAQAEQVMTLFLRPERQRLYEFATLEDRVIDEPPGRTVVPGHALESMWFMIHIYRQIGKPECIRQAIDAIRWHIEYGWDTEFGGIVLARDAQASRWEKIADTKIWWPHTEALYALLLAYSISKEEWCLDWFERVHNYAFGHFPVPQYGEWVQNLDRQGHRLGVTVGLPVKDPFHLARSLVYTSGLIAQFAAGKITD